MNDDDIRRKQDLENLAMIPVIKTKMESMAESLNDISYTIKSYNGMRTDVDWLKKFFWIIATGTGTALILAILKIVIK